MAGIFTVFIVPADGLVGLYGEFSLIKDRRAVGTAEFVSQGILIAGADIVFRQAAGYFAYGHDRLTGFKLTAAYDGSVMIFNIIGRIMW